MYRRQEAEEASIPLYYKYIHLVFEVSWGELNELKLFYKYK